MLYSLIPVFSSFGGAGVYLCTWLHVHVHIYVGTGGEGVYLCMWLLVHVHIYMDHVASTISLHLVFETGSLTESGTPGFS